MNRRRPYNGVVPFKRFSLVSCLLGLSAMWVACSTWASERQRDTPVLAFPEATAQIGAIGLQRVYEHVRFNRPVYLAQPADDRPWVYVVEQPGRILVLQEGQSDAEAHVLADWRDDVGGPVSDRHNEEGLLGLCFDPDFPVNGHLYVHYSMASPRRSRIARYTVSFSDDTAPPELVPDSGLDILTVRQPYGNHNCGMLEFGPDGMLYIGMGDGGSGGDPHGHGQNTDTLLGTLLRLDVRSASAAQPYVIPPDNPFAGGGGRGEIWAYGLRNPWRFSFDRDTGELWCGDVGQNAWEEIDRIVRGGNYGWRVREADHVFHANGLRPADELLDPVVSYPHTAGGASVVGGYVYRGQAWPQLRGLYLYGDTVHGTLYGLRWQDGEVLFNEQLAELSQICSFGEDVQGELYAISLEGRIYRIVAPLEQTSPVAPFPGLLSETGLFSDLATLSPSPGVIAYEVNAELYSDGAHKRRWIALPEATQIVFHANEPWEFPVGTVLVKHFDMPVLQDGQRHMHRLETRVLVHQQHGWAGYTYRWREDQRDAELLQGRRHEMLQVPDDASSTGYRRQRWLYPSRTDCMQCHTAAAGRVLGVRTAQLNREVQLAGGAPVNQLADWARMGYFSEPILSSGDYEAWPNPLDDSADVTARARAYLAANCAHCHLSGGPTPSELDLRFGVDILQMHAVHEQPLQRTSDQSDTCVVLPGYHERSELWLRMRALDHHRMPRLGSYRADEDGLALIGAWIDGMPQE